jgi:5-methylcytosine-specific restriction endonuclease McrA
MPRVKSPGSPARRALKRHLLAADPRCFWCGTPLTRRSATFDHVVPVSRGGSRGAGNVELACRRCNGTKGDRMPTDEEIGRHASNVASRPWTTVTKSVPRDEPGASLLARFGRPR